MTNELLSPAGTKEAFYAAISSGANAIYLGLDKFSARAYADNFTIENLKILLIFAHLRNVKIYVTINTIVYDDELEEVYKTIDELANMGVDGIIVQDLAVLSYITNHYKSLPAHASTQMGIDDLDAATLVKGLGVTRIVFARETSVELMKQIKEDLKIEVEAFIHGALCVSYSGNCFMSSMIGDRSGNRGRCAGCCRKLYTLVDKDEDKDVETGYLLSMKDLNVSNDISKMKFVDSFKIEGRMKEPNYVAGVTNIYRNILDNTQVNKDNLNKMFNRTFTRGFMNGETSTNITNIEKPNNYGYFIGTIDRQGSGKIWIKLCKPLNKGDQIRIESDNKFEEISVPVLKLFDSSFKAVPSLNRMAVVSCDKPVSIGAKVYKTKDVSFLKDVDNLLREKEYQKIDVDMEFSASLGRPLFLKVICGNNKVFIKSECIPEPAESSETTKEDVIELLSKLKETPYKARNLDINLEEGLFIPLKYISDIRREAISKLNVMRSERKVVLNEPTPIVPQKFDIHTPIITVEVSNDEQYEAVKELGIEHIYYKNVVRRNNATYVEANDEVLVGGLGGVNHYKNANTVVSDYSLNVSNHVSVALLSSLGVKRVTLSQEINKDGINALVRNYFNTYNTYPNLELIVYGRSKLMHTKYCPLKRLGLCGRCKKSHYQLRDDFASFPLLFNDDCTINILNSRTLNIIDDLDELKGINYYRLVFTTESVGKVKEIVEGLRSRINGVNVHKTFNTLTDTRGHFINNPL